MADRPEHAGDEPESFSTTLRKNKERKKAEMAKYLTAPVPPASTTPSTTPVVAPIVTQPAAPIPVIPPVVQNPLIIPPITPKSVPQTGVPPSSSSLETEIARLTKELNARDEEKTALLQEKEVLVKEKEVWEGEKAGWEGERVKLVGDKTTLITDKATLLEANNALIREKGELEKTVGRIRKELEGQDPGKIKREAVEYLTGFFAVEEGGVGCGVLDADRLAELKGVCSDSQPLIDLYLAANDHTIHLPTTNINHLSYYDLIGMLYLTRSSTLLQTLHDVLEAWFARKEERELSVGLLRLRLNYSRIKARLGLPSNLPLSYNAPEIEAYIGELLVDPRHPRTSYFLAVTVWFLLAEYRIRLALMGQKTAPIRWTPVGGWDRVCDENDPVVSTKAYLDATRYQGWLKSVKEVKDESSPFHHASISLRILDAPFEPQPDPLHSLLFVLSDPPTSRITQHIGIPRSSYTLLAGKAMKGALTKVLDEGVGECSFLVKRTEGAFMKWCELVFGVKVWKAHGDDEDEEME